MTTTAEMTSTINAYARFMSLDLAIAKVRRTFPNLIPFINEAVKNMQKGA